LLHPYSAVIVIASSAPSTSKGIRCKFSILGREFDVDRRGRWKERLRVGTGRRLECANREREIEAVGIDRDVRDLEPRAIQFDGRAA
jgi:hypothetical protein